MARNSQRDAEVGWIVRRIFQAIMVLIAIASWIPIVFKWPIAMNSFWDWMPWTPKIFLWSCAITFSGYFFVFFIWPLIKRAFAYPGKYLQERADEIERAEIEQRKYVARLIDQFIALSKTFSSPEELSQIAICEEELQKIGLMPEDRSALQLDGLKNYLGLIKPYVQTYGINRAREEGLKFLGQK